ncbi:hypothetical protein FEG31_19215 [Acinetobacter baumannii]|nr:hypothetical protein FEG31_19215 [Acinetobacter baumannii]
MGHYTIYISSVRVFVTQLLLNGWTDFNEIFCVPSSGFENGLDLQISPTDGDAVRNNIRYLY